jgi:hypothetical protein
MLWISLRYEEEDTGETGAGFGAMFDFRLT